MKTLGQQLRQRIPSSEEEQAALGRVWSSVERTGGRIPDEVLRDVERSAPALRGGSRVLLMGAAAVTLAVAVGGAIVWPRGDAALYRVVEGVVDGGAAIRTNGGGAVLALGDGSRVEMRSQSELSFERADDGLRIRLNRGGIIVNAAEQRTGHLYVETRDVTVSVVGTVFLVNTSEDGSRVAVIEGEVRVQQGTTEQTLLPGQQVTTASLDERPVSDAIAWSRNAPALVALLQQSAAVPPALPQTQNVTAADRFEVASIRPTRYTRGGERGAGGGGGVRPSLRPAGDPCGDHPNSFFLQFDPSRVLISDMTVYGLIAWAYSIDCRTFEGSELLVGGPGWVKDDGYDIEALVSPGTQAFTVETFPGPRGRTGQSQRMTPQFRRMLQTLLAERFNLVLRREARQFPAYDLVVAKSGPKLTPSKEGDARLGSMGVGLYERITNSIVPRPDYSGLIVGAISGRKMSMEGLSSRLSALVGRPVTDRTGIDGEFTLEFFFAPEPFRRVPNETGPVMTTPSLFTALDEELGLTLEEAKRPIEVMVIGRADRPAVN
jgi:uncharacterized protein (TIGR03435 family)